MKDGKYIMIGLGIAMAVLILFWLDCRTRRNSPGEPQTIKVDTLVIHDTIKVTEPDSVTKKVVDSVLVPITDTIRLRDTLYVFLEREQVRWEDSLSRVYASGINPQVDSVIHYTRDRIVTREIPVIRTKKTRWGVGFQVGVAVGKSGMAPYIGGGVSYNLLSW